MEIYEVSTPVDRAAELIKWLSTKGISDPVCRNLQEGISRQLFGTVISSVLEEAGSVLKQATDEGK